MAREDALRKGKAREQGTRSRSAASLASGKPFGMEKKRKRSRPRRVASVAVAIGTAAALFVPARLAAFTVEGGSLDLDHRGVRVFNNFSNPEANENTTPSPNFPGALGATLAIWKGTVEWGSELHGDGNGDPTQPGGLGSGGANFDPTWQGLATNPGRTNDNIISAIAGSNFGVLAFTELPIEDGWRIRFYQGAAVWKDNPDNYPVVAGEYDIQGVATHEYGHALGMGHSSDPNATMAPSHSDNWIPSRSIEADDIAGIQSIYGVKSPAKPHIATYSIANRTVTITGWNFAANDNEVWFTHAPPANDGSPFRVSHVASLAGGTELVLRLPALSAKGDLLVRIPGDGGASLSNAFPFDPTSNPCPGAQIYGTAKTTSIGTIPDLFTSGTPHLVTNDFLIGTGGGIPGATCVLFYGPSAGSTPWLGGTLYVDGPLQRLAPMQLDFFGGLTQSIPIDEEMIGTTRYYQLWFQDAGDPFGSGISNAVSVTFCP
jgi:Matrixin